MQIDLHLDNLFVLGMRSLTHEVVRVLLQESTVNLLLRIFRHFQLVLELR